MEETFNKKAAKLLQLNSSKQNELDQLSNQFEQFKSNFQVEKQELERKCQNLSFALLSSQEDLEKNRLEFEQKMQELIKNDNKHFTLEVDKFNSELAKSKVFEGFSGVFI